MGGFVSRAFFFEFSLIDGSTPGVRERGWLDMLAAHIIGLVHGSNVPPTHPVLLALSMLLGVFSRYASASVSVDALFPPPNGPHSDRLPLLAGKRTWFRWSAV